MGWGRGRLPGPGNGNYVSEPKQNFHKATTVLRLSLQFEINQTFPEICEGFISSISRLNSQ